MFTSNNWILFYVFLMFVVSSICTYTKSLRDSWFYLVFMISSSIAGSWLWVIASRRLNETKDLVWFSTMWDILMLAAFYGIPFLFVENKMNWQSWGAIVLILTGILWFKSQIGVHE